ncbi:MAG: flagellar basal body-associated FliL family protein [Deltaproteobacteria bacterium]|nr:flagellar basal body-associated FliL family protein [Deltaproteobacteria bacterium]
MSEEAAKPAEEAPKKSKLVPMIGSGVVVLAGALAALWYLGVGPFAGGAPKHGEATAAVEDGGHGGGGEHGGEAAEGHGGGGGGTGGLLSLEPFIANLADDGGRRYLKATFQIDFGGAEIPAAMQARLPQTRDLLLTLFTSKTFEEIRTPEGKQQLREEIIARVNQVLDRDLAKAVYFTEFIVQ